MHCSVCRSSTFRRDRLALSRHRVKDKVISEIKLGGRYGTISHTEEGPAFRHPPSVELDRAHATEPTCCNHFRQRETGRKKISSGTTGGLRYAELCTQQGPQTTWKTFALEKHLLTAWYSAVVGIVEDPLAGGVRRPHLCDWP